MSSDSDRAAACHCPQDARKGVKFVDLPPVLNLQLKRFEYDFQRDTMVKVRGRGCAWRAWGPGCGSKPANAVPRGHSKMLQLCGACLL